MREIDGVVDTIRCDVVDPSARRWSALEADYKSLTVAIILVGLVVGLGVHIPW